MSGSGASPHSPALSPKTADKMPATAEVFSDSAYSLALIQLQLKAEKVPADLLLIAMVCILSVCLIGRNRMLFISVLGSFWFEHCYSFPVKVPEAEATGL